MPGKTTVATCQFPVVSDISANLYAIKSQMMIAHAKGADVVHFSECSLSGYAGLDFNDIEEQDDGLLQDAFHTVKETALYYKLWTIVGSHHFEPGRDKPFNSLYLINPFGGLSGRYDKRLLTGGDGGWDQKYYIPGSEPVVFEINGILCGLLICHEWRYPEVYREYKRLGVELVFQSWYDGNMTYREYQENGKNLGEVIIGTVRGNAANNCMWISASNTSKKESCFPSFVVQPDGILVNKKRRNIPGVLISRIDTERAFGDPSGHLRNDIDKYINN